MIPRGVDQINNLIFKVTGTIKFYWFVKGRFYEFGLFWTEVNPGSVGLINNLIPEVTGTVKFEKTVRNLKYCKSPRVCQFNGK